MADRYSLDELLECIHKRGGMLADTDGPHEIAGRQRVNVICQDGHAWQTSPARLRRGHWCPHCGFSTEALVRQFLEIVLSTELPAMQPDFLKDSGPQTRYILDGFSAEKQIAFEYHGAQHYRYVPVFHDKGRSLEQQQARDAHVREICAGNHIRLIEIPEIPQGFTAEKLVTHCQPIVEAVIGYTLDANLIAAALAAPFSVQKLSKLQQHAKNLNGACLSTKFLGAMAKHAWRCEHGHEWEATWNSVQHKGSWCLVCAGMEPPSFDSIQQTAQERGGVCLSPPEEYTRNTSKLLWRCAAGHEWRAQWAGVKNGNWCAVCAGKAPLAFERIEAKAQENGGACLSAPADYQHALKSKLVWQCAHGHQWSANWNRIRAGHWCPTCSRDRWLVLRRAGAFGGKPKTLQ